jgi:hypothetical protein
MALSNHIYRFDLDNKRGAFCISQFSTLTCPKTHARTAILNRSNKYAIGNRQRNFEIKPGIDGKIRDHSDTGRLFSLQAVSLWHLAQPTRSIDQVFVGIWLVSSSSVTICSKWRTRLIAPHWHSAWSFLVTFWRKMSAPMPAGANWPRVRDLGQICAGARLGGSCRSAAAIVEGMRTW